jgi:predicted nucleic acid-binding protein
MNATTVLAFVDTNVWVYALTTTDKPRQQQADALLRSLDTPCINGQVLRELGRVLLQKQGVGEAAFRELIPVILGACLVAQDSANTLLLASDLRERYKLAYWDSLIVAAALELGCDTLYTEDMQHKQVIDGRLTLINPFVAA